MQSNLARVIVAVISIAAIVVLFVLLAGEETDEATRDVPAEQPAAGQPAGDGEEGEGGAEDERERQRPPATTLRVRDGQGEVENLSYEQGDRVRLLFVSDVTEEVHIHGYDIYVDVEPGSRERVNFIADLDGVFEVEAHGSGAQIARLSVTP